jgi:hypothetical protein
MALDKKICVLCMAGLFPNLAAHRPVKRRDVFL